MQLNTVNGRLLKNGNALITNPDGTCHQCCGSIGWCCHTVDGENTCSEMTQEQCQSARGSFHDTQEDCENHCSRTTYRCVENEQGFSNCIEERVSPLSQSQQTQEECEQGCNDTYVCRFDAAVDNFRCLPQRASFFSTPVTLEECQNAGCSQARCRCQSDGRSGRPAETTSARFSASGVFFVDPTRRERFAEFTPPGTLTSTFSMSGSLKSGEFAGINSLDGFATMQASVENSISSVDFNRNHAVFARVRRGRPTQDEQRKENRSAPSGPLEYTITGSHTNTVRMIDEDEYDQIVTNSGGTRVPGLPNSRSNFEPEACLGERTITERVTVSAGGLEATAETTDIFVGVLSPQSFGLSYERRVGFFGPDDTSPFSVEWEIDAVEAEVPSSPQCVLDPFTPPPQNTGAAQLMAMALKSGPGTQLKFIFAELGFPPCQRCSRLAAEMDMRGAKWCRDNRQSLRNAIEENSRRLGIRSGVISRLGTDTLLKIAIQRAEGKSNVFQSAIIKTAKYFV